MSSDAAEVVRRYFAAWPARDRAGAEALVAADFHFTSPLDNRLDRETFFARCWPNSETTRSLDLKRVVLDGATVFVTTSSPTRKAIAYATARCSPYAAAR